MKKIIALILAAMMLLALFTGCGSSSAGSSAQEPAAAEQAAEPAVESAEEAEAPADAAEAPAGLVLDNKETEAGTLVIGANGYPIENFDFKSSRNAVALGLCFDTLLAYDWVDGERGIKPLLAESYEYIEDDGVWKLHIHLRDGIHFQNGEPITASDVLFTYAGILDSGFSGSYAAIDIENSYVEGDQDVYFTMFYYDAGLTSVMCEYIVGIFSEDWYTNATEDDFWNAPVGSGPFKLVEMVAGSHMRFAVDEDYWGWGIVQDRPAYDEILVNVYSDASTMYIDYEMGKLDTILTPGTSDLERAVEDSGTSTVRIVPGLKFRFLAFPEYFEPFQNENVRKAIAMAIDVPAVVEAAYGVGGGVATGYMPQGTMYRVDFGTNEYDPEGAKALLEQEGYGDGFTINFVTDQDAQQLVMAEIIQAELAEIGVTMNIESYEASVAIPMYRNGECDAFFCMTSSNGYPSSIYMNVAESTSTMKGIMSTDPELNDYLDRGAGETDPAEAQAIYEWVQNWQHDHTFSVPLVEVQCSFIYREYVDGSNVNCACNNGVWDLRNFDFVTE